MTKNGNRNIKNTIFTTEEEAQYDEKAKEILIQKSVLAHILVKTVEEFKGMDTAEVIPLIEGEPVIGAVPVDPGMTNIMIRNNGEKIIGLNTENRELYEGTAIFDILFYVRTGNGLVKIIINIEAQKDEPTKYHILNRATFYVCRMISSQKEREFVKSEYNEIKQVYSIWICMNRKKNSLEHIHFTKDSLVGEENWKGRLDLLNIVMIGLTEKIPEQGEKYELHRLLGTLLSQTLGAEEKIRIVEEEYHVSMEEKFREDINLMCNLSQGVKEAGIRSGKEFMVNVIVQNMQEQGYSIKQIADVLKISCQEVNDRMHYQESYEFKTENGK